MKQRRIRSQLVAALTAAALWATAYAALEVDRFVAGWPIELPAAQGVFDVPLTFEVYRYAQEIEQLAILDEGGEPMPFYRVGAPPIPVSEQRTVLGASPLYASPPTSTVADVSVGTGADRTNVTLIRPPGDANAEIVGFVVDARSIDRAPVAMELDWRDLEQPFLFEVSVEHSRTLTGWRSVGMGSVAALSIDGARVRHARVPVTAEPGGYYRIGVSRSVPEWYLEGITLITAESEPGATQETALLAPAERPERTAANSLYFDAGGRFPVSSVSLDFDATNGWAIASVAIGDSSEGPWRTVVPARMFYETDFRNAQLASAPAAIGRVEARHWQVTFEGETTPDVELELEHPPEHLRFAARGTAPYLLAGGTLANEAGPDPTFAAVWRELQASGSTALPAALGPRSELGGTAALQEPFSFPWRRAVLWAVLAAGVLGVAWMAIRLGRDLLRPPQ